MPQDMPDKMPEDMSDRMPEDLPVTKRIDVMVGITRSKVLYVYFGSSVSSVRTSQPLPSPPVTCSFPYFV